VKNVKAFVCLLHELAAFSEEFARALGVQEESIDLEDVLFVDLRSAVDLC
jgi:hypothetical protein